MASETLQTERQQTKRSPQQTAPSSGATESPGPLLGGELGAPAAILRSGGRGNGPTKAAAVQRLQQTHGNYRTVAILQRAQALPQGGGTVAAAQASSTFTVAQIPNVISGLGDRVAHPVWGQVFRLLDRLAMPDLLPTLGLLANGLDLSLLQAHLSEAVGCNPLRLSVAIWTVQLTRTGEEGTQRELCRRLGAALPNSGPAVEGAVRAYLIAQAPAQAPTGTPRTPGGSPPYPTVGPTAPAPQATATPYPTAAPADPQMAAALGGIGPGPWNPPGNKPRKLYVGEEVHDAIAVFYRVAHATEAVFTNQSPIQSILPLFGVSPANSNLTEQELKLKPDILNVTKRHLYEIKSVKEEALAPARAAMYISLFIRAGIPIIPGPMAEPGTFGIVPAPGGFADFEATKPGAIIYHKHNGSSPVPVPVPTAVPVPTPAPTSSREAASARMPSGVSPSPAPLPSLGPIPVGAAVAISGAGGDFIEYVSKVTGLVGWPLALYLFVSEVSRLYPPRNFAPVP